MFYHFSAEINVPAMIQLQQRQALFLIADTTSSPSIESEFRNFNLLKDIHQNTKPVK